MKAYDYFVSSHSNCTALPRQNIWVLLRVADRICKTTSDIVIIHHSTTRFDFLNCFIFFFRRLRRLLGRFATSLKLASLALLAKHRANNINRRGRLEQVYNTMFWKPTQICISSWKIKTDPNLHKRFKLKLVTRQQTWRAVRLLRETCDFSTNSRFKNQIAVILARKV